MVLGHGRLDRLCDTAKQLQPEIVAGLECPVGEANEIGEDDRHALVTHLAFAAFGHRLPDLQRAQASLLEYSRPLLGELAEAPSHDAPRFRARGGKRVAVAGIAGQQLAGDPHRGQQLGAHGALLHRLGLRIWLWGVVGHRVIACLHHRE